MFWVLLEIVWWGWGVWNFKFGIDWFWWRRNVSFECWWCEEVMIWWIWFWFGDEVCVIWYDWFWWGWEGDVEWGLCLFG